LLGRLVEANMPMSKYMRGLRKKVGHRLLELPAVSVAVRDKEDRVLLVRHAETGEWIMPGGALEPCELPADAAIRETWEETGLHVRLVRLTGVYGGPEYVVRYRNGDLSSYALIVFEGEVIGGTARPDGCETLEVGFFSREEIESLRTPGWMSEVLGGVLSGAPEATFRSSAWAPPKVV
jgi:8-oxo-dGTP pyrophosphatase MutT (NUDIX family)